MPIRRSLILLALSWLASPPSSIAAQEPHAEVVRFAAGASSATIAGSIRGHEIVDYVLGASEGQVMSILLDASSTANYFNLLPPGSRGEAIHIGSNDGNEFAGTLEVGGTTGCGST